MKLRPAVLATFGVFAVALLSSLATVPLEPHMQEDAVGHLLKAKDCLLGNGCYLRLGPFSGQSVVGVSHGAAFSHLLVLVLGLGGGSAHWHLLAAVTHALAATLLFLLARRAFQLAILPALAVTWLCQRGLMAWVLPETMSNPALLPLPSALLLAAAFSYLQTGKTRHLLAAALAVGIGLQLHLTFAFHALTLGLLLLWTPRAQRPRHSALAAGVVLGSIALISPAMFEDVQPSLTFLTASGGRDRAIQGPLGLPLLLLVAGVLAAALLAWQRRRQAQVDRFLLLLLLGSLPFQILLLLLTPPGQAYYNAPFIAGSLLLCAALPLLLLDVLAPPWWLALRRDGLPWPPWRTAQNILALLIFAWVLHEQNQFLRQRAGAQEASATRAQGHLPMRAAAALAGRFGEQQGWTIADFLRHLRGTSGDVSETLEAIAYFLPGQRAVQTPTAARQDLVAVRVPARDLPPVLPQGWTQLSRARDSSVLVLAYAPWLDWDRYLVCRRQRGEAGPCTWQEADYQRHLVKIHEDDKTLWAAQRHFVLEIFNRQQGCALFGVRVPLRVPAHAAPRTLLLPGLGFDARTCNATIAAVSGVAHRGPLPARSVEVLGGEADASGELLLVLDSCVPTQRVSPLYRPPSLVELDAASLALFAKAAPPPQQPPLVLQPADLSSFQGGRVVPALRQPSGDAEPEPTAPLAYAYAMAVLMLLALAAAVASVARCLARDKETTL